MHFDKRQGYFTPPDQESSSNVYYKEWAIFAAVVLAVVTLLILLRASGRRRIRDNKPLSWYNKYLFPATYRNGPPYNQPVPLTSIYVPHGRFGHHINANDSSHPSVVPPPPSYDPYATNLPPYQAKHEADVGTSEVPATSNEAQYNYTIPESIARR